MIVAERASPPPENHKRSHSAFDSGFIAEGLAPKRRFAESRRPLLSPEAWLVHLRQRFPSMSDKVRQSVSAFRTRDH